MELFPVLRDIARLFAVILALVVFGGCPKVEKQPDNARISTNEGTVYKQREVKFKGEKRAAKRPTSADSKTSSPREKAGLSGTETTAEKQEPEKAQANEDEYTEEKATEDDLTEETNDSSTVSEDEDDAASEQMAGTRDLGPPLVDHPENLKKAHPVYPVWIDAVDKQVVMQGEICQTEVPLEMFACLRGTKEHESVVAVPTEAFIVHGALLAIGAKPGAPVQFYPEYVPASGSEIEITVRWKNTKGEVQTARAQDWIRDIKTGKALDHPWVFAGSGFWKDETTDKEYYKAEGGDFICVANFPSAMLDLPIRSSESNAELLFQAFTEKIPPRDTPVTLILKPKTEGEEK